MKAMTKINDPDLGKRPAPITGDPAMRSAKRKQAEAEKRNRLLAEIEAEFGPQLRNIRAAISQSWGTYKVKY
jgi:hypothetical protein